jgi:hypothetical protein
MRLVIFAPAALALVSVVSLSTPAHADGSARAMAFQFTPTKHAQIAIWIEKADGTFLSTVGLTQAVSVRGIGNRPGADQMNSGYHWPYGRREAVLPIWAHRRAEAPGAKQFPRIIFQNRPEGWASRYCEDSTPDSYFCLAFGGDASKNGLDATSCASGFNSDKGRAITQTDIAGGYAEPAELGGKDVTRPLSLTSLYPPRRDINPCKNNEEPVCTPGKIRGCNDSPEVQSYDAEARAVMPDIDAVTMATPMADTEKEVMFSIPDDWQPGEYVAWVEINTEGDYNDTYNDTVYPTPSGSDWDSWAEQTGYPYRGQPSVIYQIPFSLGTAAVFSTSTPVGYASVDGNEPDIGMLHIMDGTITDDPADAPGSGADRLRQESPDKPRVAVELRDCPPHDPPQTPQNFDVVNFSDPKHSQEWGSLSFVVADSLLPIARYTVQYSEKPLTDDPASFAGAHPALAADTTMSGLVIPTGQAKDTPVNADFGKMSPSTHYWVAIQAVDICNVASKPAIAELSTTRTNFTQLSGCFVATAAYGSPLEPQVSALRRVRDRLWRTNSLFTVGADLYYRNGPAAAEVLRRSDVARALARSLIGPLGSLASAGLSTAAN